MQKDICEFCMTFVDLSNQRRIWATVPPDSRELEPTYKTHYGCTRCFGARVREQMYAGHTYVEFMEQLQPNKYACVATALACSVGLPVQCLMDLVGHDGTTPVNEEFCTGFQIDEFVRPMLDIGYAICQHKKSIVYGKVGDGLVQRENELFEKYKPWAGLARVNQKTNDHVFALAGDLWYDTTTGVYVAPRDAIEYYTVHRLYDLI